MHHRFDSTVNAVSDPACHAKLPGALAHRFAEKHTLYAAVNEQMPGNHDIVRAFILNPYPESITRIPDALLLQRVSN